MFVNKEIDKINIHRNTKNDIINIIIWYKYKINKRIE